MKESNWFQLIWASCAIMSLSSLHPPQPGQGGGGARGQVLPQHWWRVDRDEMSQYAQINLNLLDSLILIQFLKKKCLVF